MSLEHTCEAALLVGTRGAEMEGTGDIGRSINVLSTRIAKVNKIGIDPCSGGLLRLVVDDGSIGTG